MLKLDISSYGLPATVQSHLVDLCETVDVYKMVQKGSNGYLFFAENPILKKRIAIKYYYWGGDDGLHAEPELLASLKHRNILAIHHAERVCKEWAYFTTDFCKNGDLDDFMNGESLSLKNSLQVALDVLSGLSVIHSHRLLHRDLKPQNILLDDMEVATIGDFGSVRRIPDGADFLKASGHSIIYRPPEAFRDSRFSIASDLYQIGIVLYQLVGGNLPYDGEKYLNSRERDQFQRIPDQVERVLFIDRIIQHKIVTGRLLDMSSIPIWIDKPVRRIITKATQSQESRRYRSCSEMMAEIARAKHSVHDWQKRQDGLFLHATKDFRVVQVRDGSYVVYKRKHSDWRQVASFANSKSLTAVVKEIERQCSK